jgi:hypothetical protein
MTHSIAGLTICDGVAAFITAMAIMEIEKVKFMKFLIYQTMQWQSLDIMTKK